MSTTPARTTDIAALALTYGDRLILGTVRDTHRAVARRAFAPTRALGGHRIERTHDAVSDAVYGTISGALRAVGGGARSLSRRGLGRPVESTRYGRRLQSAVNGLIGDELRAVDDPHAITMQLRSNGRDVPATPWPLSQAYPEATDHLVFFVHGLCEDDESWQARAGENHIERIRRDTDGTPVVIRYNSGLHISENGKHLDTLIDAVVAAWPTRITRISFVGHSMGGLVVRAATNHAVAAQREWTGLVRDIVCLGTPHTGAALEKAAHLGARALGFWPESRAFGEILQARSEGIVDLRHGYISADEWQGQDLTARWGLDRIAAAPLPHADYHFVAATLGARRGHIASLALGDLLVQLSSAHGSARSGAVVDGARLEYLPSAHHFALLHHPRVGAWLVEWLNSRYRSPRALPTG